VEGPVKTKEQGAAQQEAKGTKVRDDEGAETCSPLDPEVEAPINAAIHSEDVDFELANVDSNEDVEVTAPENGPP
jgi:hypothetical protein